MEPDKEKVAPKDMEPEVKPDKISTGDINVTFVPGILQFDFDKNTLNADAIEKLNQLVDYLKSSDTNRSIPPKPSGRNRPPANSNPACTS